MKQVISIFPIILLVFASLTTTNIEAKMYAGPHGDLWTQEQYDYMVNNCKNMKQEGLIPLSDQVLNCEAWVLTYEGTAWITKYVLQKNGFLN